MNPVVIRIQQDPECNIAAGLVVGGIKAKLGEFPHMAAIGYPDPVDKLMKFQCGGLISQQFVLSAAHCRTTE